MTVIAPLVSMLNPPLKLTSFEFRRRMEGGLTKPLLMVAADEAGKEYQVVVKMRRPDVREGHFGATSLACELTCAVLARAVGLIVPDYAIVEIPPILAQALPDGTVRQLLLSNTGPNFGTVYQEAVFSWSPSHSTQVTPEVLNGLADVVGL